MSVGKDISRLEKNRQAQFVLAGVVAARTPGDSKRTHDAIQKICNIIMDAYKVANDGNKSRQDKIDAITKITELTPDLDWLVDFTRRETDFCRFKDLREKMNAGHNTVKGQATYLRNEFRSLALHIESFSDVFDSLLSLLEEMTEFLRLGHASEIQRVKESLDNAYSETSNLLNCELTSLLVDQAKLSSTRINDCWQATDGLVKIQPHLNTQLQPRIDNVDRLLRSYLPDFIVTTKVFLTEPNNSNAKPNQERSYRDVKSCLDEIKKILELVNAEYINQFDESASKISVPLDGIDAALNGVSKALADLKGAQMAQEPEMIVLEKAEEVPKWTKIAIEELKKMNATPEQQKAFIDAVKRARDGGAEDYFAARDAFNAIVEDLKAPRKPVVLQVAQAEEGRGKGDLLAAAKEMCAALSKLNLAMDE